MPSMSRDRFLKEYVLAVEKEFELDGSAADWAPSTSGGPLRWGQESSSMDIVKNDTREKHYMSSAAIALSPDNAYIAVASNTVIRIYTTVTKEIRAELVGHLENIGDLLFAEDASKADAPKGTKYVILSSSRTTIAWYLDADGKSLTRTMPFAVGALADKAMTAISEDLTSHHELDTDALAEIRQGFATTLSTADMKNRLHSLTHWKGQFPSFGSKPISADGTRWLHAVNNESTQGGPREPDLLPTIVVREFSDINSAKKLSGHKDAIMWASFSPTNSDIIATAGWDGTYRIWSVSTGTELHQIGPMDVQNWSGDFSPDGKHVLLAGTNNVGIYSVATGEQVYKLEREDLKTEAWIRYLSWSPSGDAIALCNGIRMLLWRPFDGDRVDEIFKLKVDDRIYSSFVSPHTVRWLNQSGQMLAIADGENSYFVWDRKRNLKWRFERPTGKELGVWGNDCLYDSERKTFITLNGDWKIREWKLE